MMIMMMMIPSKDLRRHVQFHYLPSIHEAAALASEFESFEERFDERKPENLEKEFGTSVRSINRKHSRQEELLKVCQCLRKQVAASLGMATKSLDRTGGAKAETVQSLFSVQ